MSIVISRDARAIGFLLLDGFSLMSFAAALEPLRGANVLSGRRLYQWHTIGSGRGEPLASSGAAFRPDHRVGDDLHLDLLLVCAGGNPAHLDDRAVLQWLRHLARGGTQIGGISGGPYLLARAGLLAGRRCTIHWEHAPAFTEDFPELDLRRTLYEIDGGRLTCAGGIAALDMMHEVIARDHGFPLARAVSEWFLQTQVRVGDDAQRMGLPERFAASNPHLIRALEIVEAEIERPPNRTALARRVGISVRHLERLFAGSLRTSIDRHGLAVRLDRARDLLRQTSLSIVEVAVACGFASPSHFSRVFRQRFGASPRESRAAGVPSVSAGLRRRS